ncbi:MAG: hypothetical protein ABW164_07140 [Sphingobium sp.]
MAFPIASAIFLLLQTAVSPATLPEPLVATPATLPEPLVATPDDAGPMRLHVGDTGIRCLRLPCPSRGVFVPDDQGHAARDRMLYTDVDGKAAPPPMIGDKALLAAIGSAWEARTCLAIDGRLVSGEGDRPVLRVDRVIGPCRDRAE